MRFFCKGNNSSSRSLARFYRRKHKKSKARAFWGNSDEASVSCPTTSSRNDATPPKIWPECSPQTWKENASCWYPFTTAPEAHSWYTRVLWFPSSHGDGQSAFLRYKDFRAWIQHKRWTGVTAANQNRQSRMAESQRAVSQIAPAVLELKRWAPGNRRACD